MSTQYRLVQSGKTASGGCSAGQGSSEPVAPRIYLFYYKQGKSVNSENEKCQTKHFSGLSNLLLMVL
jgi:carbohydrate-binding DOMON domain-containing protein